MENYDYYADLHYGNVLADLHYGNYADLHYGYVLADLHYGKSC